MQPKFAPREIFEQILEWAVIPTFDLVIEYGDQGLIMVRRKIEPYSNVWAFPGLRMYKGEEIVDTIKRIAKQELGLEIDPLSIVFLGQYVGKFKTEHERQDLSTGYFLRVSETLPITLNQDHFSTYIITKVIPSPIGAMYRFYFERYLKMKSQKLLE
ncbi:TPA: NUDIX domain-containing protein [Candidatus Woesearchaeota archaeon]|nr:NUDIX domain-containing protein [Candidatus Woesearchaeota archaeon]